MIPYGRHDITQADLNAVIDVLKSDYLTQGPVLGRFEDAISTYTSSKHAVSVNSATSALHLACVALELGPGDILWTSPITFVASANCGVYCGANIDFVDIDPDTFNICPESLKEKFEQAAKDERLPKVLIPVHMCGQSPNMKLISDLAKHYGVKIIEDASHAIGSKYLDKPVGNCAYSDITVFSFHPVKIITTAEGGVATTNDSVLAEKMRLYRSHGITRNPNLMVGRSDGLWYYQQIELGWNYRMTDIQAALGLSQMVRLDAYIARRHELAHRYNRALYDLELSTPVQCKESYSSFHLYVVLLKNPEIHHRVFEDLRNNGIGVNLHYIPVHLQPFYQKFGFSVGDFPKSENYYSRAISLPLFPTMTKQQQDEVISQLVALLA